MPMLGSCLLAGPRMVSRIGRRAEIPGRRPLASSDRWRRLTTVTATRGLRAWTGGAGRRRYRHRAFACAAVVVGAAASLLSPGATALASTSAPSQPDFGPNVYVFSPSMPQSQIQATVNSIASQQVSNQFGTQRYALLFEPGTYVSKADPLSFQVGYYTTVAGLGSSPGDVVINGAVDSFNECSSGGCTALVNFWRSLSNLTINVMASPSLGGCHASAEFWATSQASPMRRVNIHGLTTLFDYCSGPGFSSGGYIADSQFTGSTVINGTQQQFFVRNSNLDGWTNNVWNQVFTGDPGAPAQNFGSGGQYTTLAASPVTREAPFLYTAADGSYQVFLPAVEHDTSGPSWASGSETGTSKPLSNFFVASPASSLGAINSALAQGRSLVLTPGVYDLSGPIVVSHPDTVVLGLGFATLVPQDGSPAIIAPANTGVRLYGLMVDAGPMNSPFLVSVGTPGHTAGPATDPDTIQDVFFRVGGAETTATSATVSLLDNASNSIIDDVWAWRADHGNDVGWTANTGATGLVVTGNGVTAYGLAVEHYQKSEVIWTGQGGTEVFFQNELPYDPPSQADWMLSPTQNGYPAFLVTPNVTTFTGYGMGSYVVFIQTTATLHDAAAFQAPAVPGVRFNDVFGVWISGSGGLDSIVNGVGGPVTSVNPG